jgi:hypothetical protein
MLASNLAFSSAAPNPSTATTLLRLVAPRIRLMLLFATSNQRLVRLPLLRRGGHFYVKNIALKAGDFILPGAGPQVDFDGGWLFVWLHGMGAL